MKTLKTLTIENAPAESRDAMKGIQSAYGFIPNLMATFAHSPAVLNGYLAMDGAWDKSSLSPSDRQLILLTVSVENSCGYCTAAHTTILKNFMKADPGLMTAVQSRISTGDAKKDALIEMVRELLSERGHVSDVARKRFLTNGYSEVQLMEVLIGIALKTVSNYWVHLNPVEIDAAFQDHAHPGNAPQHAMALAPGDSVTHSK
jgi:uncharacterized peroxidase-related enzyme